MTTINVDGYTSHQIVEAVQAARHRVIILCPNPADAASPVSRIAGSHSQQIGQSADWKHRVEEAASEGQTLVEGHYDNDRQVWGWSVTGDVDRAELSDKLHSISERVRQENAASAKAARDAESAKESAERATVQAALIEVAKRLGEQWAPGQTAVSMHNGKVVVDRWDAPAIPGYGQWSERRHLGRQADGTLALSDSYVWGQK